MRTQSPKKRAEKRETDPARAAYVAANWLCQACHKRKATDCHEIVRGGSRQLAVHERCAWLALCRLCHDDLGDYAKWPVSRQLALKLLADAEHFDLEAVNRMRGRDVNAITLTEVVSWLRMGASP